MAPTEPSVATVRGDLAVSELGRTLMHEHVFTLYGELRMQADWDEEAMVALAVDKLVELKRYGFDTIVDMTVWGLGRSVPRIARISAASGVTILAATGVYAFAEMPPYFRNRTRLLDENFVAKLMIREITEGIENTGIRAAVLKCVTDAPGVTPDVDHLIRQTARAQLATGVPINTHSAAATRQGRAQQAILRECGVDLSRVIIGHSGDSTDLAYLEEVIDAGSYIGMDRFGYGSSGSLESKIDVLVGMLDRGYADRMVISHDANVFSDTTPMELRDDPVYKDLRYSCIPELVLPALRERGITQSTIDTLTITNPSRIFSTVG